MNKKTLWLGRILSALPCLLMTMSGVMKIIQAPQVTENWTPKFAFPESTLIPIGIVELACVAIYLFPRTAVLGAILIVGYLGGAISTHVRASEPFLIPLLLGIFAWGGLFLRDERLRALLPLRVMQPKAGS